MKGEGYIEGTGNLKLEGDHSLAGVFLSMLDGLREFYLEMCMSKYVVLKTGALNRNCLGLLISAGASTVAHGLLVQSPTVGSGLTPPGTPGSQLWDVDNDGTFDFELRHGSTLGTSHFAIFNILSGAGFVQNPLNSTSYGIQKLPGGYVLSAGITNYAFGTTPKASNIVTDNGSLSLWVGQSGWEIGDTGYFGFRFTNAGGVHYGWGELTFTGSPSGAGFTLNEAWYNDVVGESIIVGATAVPEPETVALGLGALALGAAGLRRWRKSKAVT